jgi:putative nucleotidyltransferase with HDIG domain
VKVLIADDSAEDRRLLRYYLEDRKFEVAEAKNGVEALTKATKNPPDLVISDGLMPEMDGFNLLRTMRADERLAHIPFVFYSSVFKDDEEAELAKSMGAGAFIVKGADKADFWTQLDRVLASNPQQQDVTPPETVQEESAYLRRYSTMVAVRLEREVAALRETEAALAADIVDRKRAEVALLKSNTQLEVLVQEIAEALGRAVEARDPYTRGHQERVSEIAQAIAAEMGLSEDDVAAIQMAGFLHDVGKLAVPAEVLGKPGKLSDVEFALIKVHPQAGYDILKGIDFPWPIAEIALQHHERMDGSGYPQGLIGAEILPLAMIISIADVIEAMASHRPYRAALGLDAALAEISGHPELYDADAVAACLRLNEAGALRV